MNATHISVLSLVAALSLSGCSHVRPGSGSSGPSAGRPDSEAGKTAPPRSMLGPNPAQADHTLTIQHTRSFDADDPTSTRTNGLHEGWVLLDENRDGALRGMAVKQGQTIEWNLHGTKRTFSIVVTNRADWSVVYGATKDWRTDAPSPFNGTAFGVIDAKPFRGNMIVQLQFNGLKGTTPYQITVPAIPPAVTKGENAFKILDDYSLVDATLIWDGTL